jgi:hypothetical protein
MFWLCLSVLHALIILIFNGPDYLLVVRFFSLELGYLSAKVYFLFSASVTSFCFGVFLYYLVRDIKRDNSYRLFEMFKDVVKNSEEHVKDYVEGKFGQISMDQYELSKEFKAFNESAFKTLEKMGSVSSELRDFRERLVGQESAIKDLKKAVDDVKVRLSPKYYLTVDSDVAKVVGVGKKTASALKSAGIKRVLELISEDSKVLAEKTGLSESVVTKIQAAAKMLIVPGFDAKVVKTLQRVGVSSLEDLACYSPMELYTCIVRAYGKEMLSFDEVAFYVRAAQLYTSKNAGVYWPLAVAFPEGWAQAKKLS